MGRLKACSGSLAAEAAVVESGVVPSDPDIDEVAEEGKLVHDWLMHDALGSDLARHEVELKLNEHALRKARQIAEKRNAILDQEIPNWRDDSVWKHAENRFWYLSKGGAKMFSAQPDLVVIAFPKAVIINYKAGWKDPEEAPDNDQIKTEVAVVAQNFQVTRVLGAIATPTNSPVLGLFEERELKANEEYIKGIVKAATAKAPRVAGEHCRFCKARGAGCEESAQFAINSVPVIADATPKDVAASLSPEMLKEVWKKGKVVEKIIEACKQRLESLPEDELAKLGLKLVPGRAGNPVFTETPQQVADRLGWTAEEMLGALALSLPKLREAWHAKYGGTKKDAERDVEFTLKGCIERKETKKVLEEV